MAKMSGTWQEVTTALQTGWQVIDFKGEKKGAVAGLRRR